MAPKLTYAKICDRLRSMSRDILKIRRVAQSLVVTLPQAILAELDINEGDRVLVEAAPPRRIVLTKEEARMPSSQLIELELDILEKRMAAIESEVTYKVAQNNRSMPIEEGMDDQDIVELTFRQLANDGNRLAVQIAEKRLELFSLQGSVQPNQPRASNPSKNDFELAIEDQFREAEKAGKDFIDLAARDIHRGAGGKSARDHRMHTCCRAMWNFLEDGDEVLYSPPKRHGPRLEIRYRLPRPKSPT